MAAQVALAGSSVGLIGGSSGLAPRPRIQKKLQASFLCRLPNLQHRRGGLQQQPRWPRLGAVCASDAAMGAGAGAADDDIPFPTGPPPVFQRISIRDPYKRLGVDRDASNEEITEAKNYLVAQHRGHEKSVEAIESAFDQIIMTKLRERRASKINLKANLKKKVAEGPGWVRNIASMVDAPPQNVILQRVVLYILLGVWSVMNPAEGGPAFQVAVALGLTIYLINDRLKSLGRAFLLGFGALIIGWVTGSLLVPVAPSFLIPRTWSLELATSLISYAFLFFSCTFLK